MNPEIASLSSGHSENSLSRDLFSLDLGSDPRTPRESGDDGDSINITGIKGSSSTRSRTGSESSSTQAVTDSPPPPLPEIKHTKLSLSRSVDVSSSSGSGPSTAVPDSTPETAKPSTVSTDPLVHSGAQTARISESLDGIHLSQVDIRVENIGNDGRSEDDTSSVISEVPPPPTPGNLIEMLMQMIVVLLVKVTNSPSQVQKVPI
eukprot:sb/3470462/